MISNAVYNVVKYNQQQLPLSKNRDDNVVQFGLFLMELMPSGNKLEGRFTGFGHESKKVIFGRVVLNN
jgi:hypothetical protein